jgi:hypothetical protein
VRSNFALLAAAAAMFAATRALAGGAIAIPAAVPFAPDFTISDAAKAECDLQKFQSDELKASLAGAGYEVTAKDGLSEQSPGQVLLMEFSSGQSTGRAMDTMHSRVNILQINGCLYDGGRVVATFMDSRFSTGGIGGEFKKTCALLHKDETAMAADIAGWVGSKPPIFSTLGDAHRGAGADIQLPAGTPAFCMMSGKLPTGMKEQWMAQHPQKK